MRLSEASQRYLATRTQEGFSPHTIRAYRLQHQILIREVGDVGLAAVTLDLLRTHLTHHGHLKSSSLGQNPGHQRPVPLGGRRRDLCP